MNSKQRAYLKGLANDINPSFQVGKSSLTPDIVKAIDDVLEKRELVKIAVFKNCPDDTAEVAEMLSERTRSAVVQVIGKKIILYRRSKKDAKIQLPK